MHYTKPTRLQCQGLKFMCARLALALVLTGCGVSLTVPFDLGSLERSACRSEHPA